MNSKRKGKRGEREAANEVLKTIWGLSAARRGQQYKGTADSPDIEGLPGVHFEVKRVERLHVDKAILQACTDAAESEDVPAVLHRRSRGEWLLTIRAVDAIAFSDALDEALREEMQQAFPIEHTGEGTA